MLETIDTTAEYAQKVGLVKTLTDPWYPSTGMGFQKYGLSHEQAARAIVRLGAHGMEFCPNGDPESVKLIPYLEDLKKAGMRLSLHAFGSLRISDTNNDENVATYLRDNKPTFIIAKQLEIPIIQHPLKRENVDGKKYPFTQAMREDFINLLESQLQHSNVPVLIENGVIGRDSQTKRVLFIEDGRTPETLHYYISPIMPEMVFDVSKAILSGENPEDNARSLKAEEDCIRDIQDLGIRVGQIHYVGATTRTLRGEYWGGLVEGNLIAQRAFANSPSAPAPVIEADREHLMPTMRLLTGLSDPTEVEEEFRRLAA